MSFHPDVIDIMHAVGVTMDQFRAIYRVQWEIDQRKGGESHDVERQGEAQDGQVPPRATASEDAVAAATPCNADATKRPLTSTERSRKRRAKQKASDMQRDAVACNVAVAGPSPSLKVINLDLEERERAGATLHATDNVAPADGPLIAMTPEWQPNKLGAKLGADELGDIGAANALAKFRDHFEASGRVLTDRQWQAKYRKWVRDERGFIRPDPAQPRLPLVQVEPSRAAPPGKHYAAIGSPQWEAWAKHTAPTGFPRDRAGGWWFETEWPPGMELRRESG